MSRERRCRVMQQDERTLTLQTKLYHLTMSQFLQFTLSDELAWDLSCGCHVVAHYLVMSRDIAKHLQHHVLYVYGYVHMSTIRFDFFTHTVYCIRFNRSPDILLHR